MGIIENKKEVMIVVVCPNEIGLIKEGVSLTLQHRGAQKRFIIEIVKSKENNEEDNGFQLKGEGYLIDRGSKYYSFSLFFNPEENRGHIYIFD